MKKNFLTLGKQLKDSLTTIRDNIWNNPDNFKSGNRRNGFLETYAGAEWYVETIYRFCDEVLECFETYESFATQTKKAFLKLGAGFYNLVEYSNDALQDLYSYYLTEVAPDDDQFYHIRDLANGEEEEYYIEPTYEDFMENITDCEYSYEYEDWNNTEEANYWLSEEIGYVIVNYAYDMYMSGKEVA